MKSAMNAINIVKRYKNNTVLNGFNMNVIEGDVYGFVGKNGAGKTTFLKILFGLVYANEGKLELFSSTDSKSLVENRKLLSGIIETPAFYSHMSANENLTAYCLLREINKSKINDSLEVVGLSKVGKKKVGKFSLGMKQRLGIARAIISDSKFVILDEPTNGLDPEGIVEFRELIAHLNKNRGITFLISSHYITELQKISNRFGLLANGMIAEELSMEELTNKVVATITVTVSNAPKSGDILKNNYPDIQCDINGSTILFKSNSIDIGKVCAMLSTNDITVYDIQKNTSLIEEYILNVIG